MRRGFTLLELLIAVFILAMAMTVLLGTQSTSMSMMGYSYNTSIVTMLTRSKMQDIEYEVLRTIKEEGIKSDYEETFTGDFGDQGYEDITWSALVQSIELSDEASEQLVDSVQKQIYGEGDEEGTLSGNTTITQFLPTMIGFMPAIINQIGQRIRRITLTTSWEFLGIEQTLTVSQFVVILDVGDAKGMSGSSVSSDESEEGNSNDSADNGSKPKNGQGNNKR